MEQSMNSAFLPALVVVGIDGSQGAIQAAQWAVEEAVSRDVPLRLVHVAPPNVQPPTLASVDNDRLHIEYGETALRMASDAVAATSKPVKVETALVRGEPIATLVAESGNAAMVCVGAVGIGCFARAWLGSTAAELAEAADCPVAIIRAHQNQPGPDSNWIVVPVDDPPENGAVVQYAMDEAQLRQAPVLALGVWHEDFGETRFDDLDQRMQTWRRRYPDVHVSSIATRADMAGFLADNRDRVQLAVLGSGDADQVARIIRPQSHPILGHRGSSVLVVR